MTVNLGLFRPTLRIDSFLLLYHVYGPTKPGFYSQDNFYLTCSRNLVAFVIYMDLSFGFVHT